MNAAYGLTKQEAVSELESLGAERLKQKDRYGDTKSGWWLDGMYLAPLSQPCDALRVIRGD